IGYVEQRANHCAICLSNRGQGCRRLVGNRQVMSKRKINSVTIKHAKSIQTGKNVMGLRQHNLALGLVDANLMACSIGRSAFGSFHEIRELFLKCRWSLLQTVD
ncbi:MAG: hypothetical protein ACK56F_29265, partial [bacterium]